MGFLDTTLSRPPSRQFLEIVFWCAAVRDRCTEIEKDCLDCLTAAWARREIARDKEIRSQRVYVIEPPVGGCG
jgi:hypothetical protein